MDSFAGVGESGFVKAGHAGADPSSQQRFIVDPARRGSTQHAHRFEEVAFAGAVGPDEQVDSAQVKIKIGQ